MGPIYLSCHPADAEFVQPLRVALNVANIPTIEGRVAAISAADRFVACFSTEDGGGGGARHNTEELRVALDFHRSRSAPTSGGPWLVAVKLSPCDLSFIPVPPKELETIEFPVSWKEAVVRIAGRPVPERGRASTSMAVDDLCVDSDVNITTLTGSGEIPSSLNAHTDLRLTRVAVGGSFNLTTARVDESTKKDQ
jgi:hypothetical protein